MKTGNTSRNNTSNKIKRNTQTHLLKVKMNDAEHKLFLKKFTASGLKTKTEFVKHLLFDKELKVWTEDKYSYAYFVKLTKLYEQYKAIGVNYNQVVKAINTNFWNALAKRSLSKLKKYTKELTLISEEILDITRKFKNYGSQN